MTAPGRTTPAAATPTAPSVSDAAFGPPPRCRQGIRRAWPSGRMTRGSHSRWRRADGVPASTVFGRCLTGTDPAAGQPQPSWQRPARTASKGSYEQQRGSSAFVAHPDHRTCPKTGPTPSLGVPGNIMHATSAIAHWRFARSVRENVEAEPGRRGRGHRKPDQCREARTVDAAARSGFGLDTNGLNVSLFHAIGSWAKSRAG